MEATGRLAKAHIPGKRRLYELLAGDAATEADTPAPRTTPAATSP